MKGIFCNRFVNKMNPTDTIQTIVHKNKGYTTQVFGSFVLKYLLLYNVGKILGHNMLFPVKICKTNCRKIILHTVY